jgi:hypothetical protein
MSLRYAPESDPIERAVASIDLRRMTAGSPSSGCATDAGGWIQVRPCSASGSLDRYGDTMPSGCAVEQTSW